MKGTSKTDDFQIRQITARERGYSYHTYQVTGYLNGERVRRRVKTLEEALGEKSRLTIKAANGAGGIQAINTRLNHDQVIEAEIAYRRLGEVPLGVAIDWFQATYKLPVHEIGLDPAIAAFLAEKAGHVRAPSMKDYRRSLRDLASAFAGRTTASITTEDIQRFLTVRYPGKKRFNNVRGDLHAFFGYCQSLPREWIKNNPVKPILTFRISLGVPEIIGADTAKDLMAYVEEYAGGPRSPIPPGSLAPYFSICLFAGLRPSVRDGEISKLSQSADLSKVVNLNLNVIRITPDMAKTKSIRQVKIQPNLAAWLQRYPLSEFPIMITRMAHHVAVIRKKFGLGNDVLRHTFISMHVAKFKSMGAAALEAGNSEIMIRNHYLNIVSETDAERFWSILPNSR